ncbi:sulfite exporter TauE/SafE family protein [Chloroflexota bacterium]
MKLSSNRLLRSPWLEIGIMLVVLVVSYIALAVISTGAETPPEGMSAWAISRLLLAFFVLSFAIAFVAVIAGIGGGVIFTPIMLAFTDVNSLIVRATGLVVAMFSGLISTGPFMRRGLGNLKLCILCTSALAVGTLVGARGALWIAEYMGPSSEGTIRMVLGGILLAIAAYFTFGSNMEWPKVKKVDRFTRWLNITQPYYEQSLGEVVDYKVTRAGGGLTSMFFIGLVSGFFGLGGGWAVTPALNLIMGVPLKVAAASSGILLGVGSCSGIWPYLLNGAIIPLFVAPWMVGQILGGLLGSYILMKVKAQFVRFILIGIMFFTSFALVTKGLKTLGYMGEIPMPAFIGVFFAIMAAVILAILGKFPNFKR